MTPSRRGFVKLDSPSHEGKTNTWLTPKYIIEALGPFELDPCAAPDPRPWKTADTMWTASGLEKEWFGRVWLNPPYGKQINLWLEKLANHGSGIALVFARTDTKWFHEAFIKCSQAFILQGRIKFCLPCGNTMHNAGHGSIFLNYGQPIDFQMFKGTLIK
jgi:hypothetical protein